MTVSVYVYSKPQCYQCDATKRMLTKNGIGYTELPLTAEIVARFKDEVDGGYLSAPLVQADYGDGVTFNWSGHRPTKIEQLKATLSD